MTLAKSQPAVPTVPPIIGRRFRKVVWIMAPELRDLLDDELVEPARLAEEDHPHDLPWSLPRVPALTP